MVGWAIGLGQSSVFIYILGALHRLRPNCLYNTYSVSVSLFFRLEKNLVSISSSEAKFRHSL